MTIQRFDIDSVKDCLTNGNTILVPNQRIRDAILHSFASTSTTPSWFTPDVNAVDVWLKNQWTSLSCQGQSPFSSLRLLDSMEESLIWIDIIDQHHQDGSLLNVEEAAASVQHAYQLYRLWIDDGQELQRLPPSSSISEFQQFHHWCRLFTSYCQQQQLISLADATLTLLREYSSGNIKPPDNMLVVNFYQPPPLYRKLFQVLTSGESECFVQTADETSDVCGQSHSFTDLETEVRACAEWARKLIDSQPEAHIGVIFGGEPAKLPAIDRIFKDTFNPAGFADLLSEQPTFNDGITKQPILERRQIDEALLLLNLGSSPLDSADFCRLLQSPAIHGHQQELEARIQLEIYIRGNLGTRCSLSQLLRIMSREDKSYHCPILLKLLIDLANRVRAHRLETPANWALIFQQQLHSLGWPAEYTALEETQAELLQAWQSVISCLSGYRSATGKINRSTAVSRLRTLCQKTALANPGDTGRQLSLYSLNDAVGLEFNHVWFLGFTDNSQPPAASPSPFIAHKLQREAAVPGSHGEVQLELARQAFRIICASTKGETHGSFHLLDGDESYRISNLLNPFNEAPMADIDHPPINRLALAACSSIEIEKLGIDNRVSLQADEQPRGGQEIFSDQSSCPFRAFAKHRLDCAPLELFRNGLDARTRGTALHIALEKLFSLITGHLQLTQLTGVQQQDLVSKCSEAAIAFLEARNPELMTPRFKSLEQERLHRLLGEYLELEKKRKEFQVVDTEKTVTWQQGQLNIRLKMDRIDRLDNGDLGIIDYKTGRYVPSVGKLSEERPENLQLPLYYWAASTSIGHSVGSVAIAQINAEKVRFHGLAAEDNVHPEIKSVGSHKEFGQDWQSLTSDWHTRLTSLAEEFIQGEARVDPVSNQKTCENCQLQPLCRIRELTPLRQYQDPQSEDAEQ